MGGFHVIICIMRSIYSRFQDSGIIELLVESGVSSEGTIRAAMKGSDIKQGIRFYKLVYETLLRSKVEHLSNVENNTEFDDLINSLCHNLAFENCNQLSEGFIHKIRIFNFPGEMANWMQSLIDMIDILLNCIHFQRIGNWEGYLQAIKEFLPWCFALNRHNYARNLSYHYIDMRNLKRNKSRSIFIFRIWRIYCLSHWKPA